MSASGGIIFNEKGQLLIVKPNYREDWLIPKEVVKLFSHAFQSLDQTRNLNLFDIKKLSSNSTKEYYRLRKEKYRAIFTIEDSDYYVHVISKRSEVYRKWP